MWSRLSRLVRVALFALPELWIVLFLVAILKLLQANVPREFSASLGWTIHPYQVFAVCVALAWFMLPGALVTRILGIGTSCFTRLPTYMAAAVGVWTVPILWVASTARYNIEYLMWLGGIMVTILAVIAYLRELWHPAHPDVIFDEGRSDLTEPLNLWLVILTISVLFATVYLSFVGPVALDDNLQVMYVQDDLVVPRINEFEPVFGVGIRPQTRGSLTTWPLSLTIMVDVTGLPAQQAFWLLKTPLVLINLLAVYALSLRLFGRRNIALLSVLFYFLLTLIYTTDADAIGFALYARNAQDKFVARYTMFPMALAWSIAYLKKPDYRAYWLAGLSTIGLSSTHPIGIILLAIPLGGLGLMHLFSHLRFHTSWGRSRNLCKWVLSIFKQNWPVIGSLMFLSIWSFIGVILPLLQRASPDAPIVAYNLTDTRDPTLWFRIGLVLNSHRIYIADYLGPGAYIVHPSIFLEAYILIPVLGLPLLFFWGKKRWETELIVGTFLLNPALLLLPPIIQFIGNRATPWLLYRFAWPLSLLGPLAIVWAVYSLLDVLRQRFPENRLHSLLPALILIITAIVLTPEIKRGLTILSEQRTDSFSSRCRTLQPLFSKLSTLVRDGTVVLSTPDNNLCMVSSAAYAYPVEFGLTTTINRFPASRVEEAVQRMNDVFTFSFAEVVDQDIMDILTRWNAELILLRADHPLVSQLQYMPQFFKLVLVEDRYLVYRVLPETGVDIHKEIPTKDRWTVVHWEGNDELVTANTFWSQEHWDDAISIYKTLVNKDETGLLGLIGLGRANLSAGRLDEAGWALQQATTRYPESIQAWLLSGSVSMVKNDYAGMELAYGQVLKQVDWHPEALSRLADAYRFQGRPVDAVFYYQRAVASDVTPGTSIYYRTLGATYLKINWNIEAAVALEKSIDIRESLLAYSLLSNVQLNMNNLEMAREIASRAKKLDTWSDVHSIISGKIELHQLHDVEAIKNFKHAIANNPESIAIANLVSTLSDTQGKQVALDEVSREIGYKLGFAEPVLAAAQIQYSVGSLEEATRLGERALKWKPVDSRSAVFLGNVKLAEGKWEHAHEYFITALNLNPFDHGAYVGLIWLAQLSGHDGTALGWGWTSMITSPYNPDTQVMVGTLQEIRGGIDDALENYQLATIIGPYDPKPFVTMGNFLLKQGLFDSAIQNYNIAIDLQPGATSAYRGLAEVNRNLGEYNKALQQIDNAMQMHPAEGANFVRGAEILIQAGNYSAARDQLLQSILLDPGYKEAYVRLGSLYMSLGRTSEAEAIYLQLLQTMPLYEDGYLRLGKLYEIKGNDDKALAIYKSGLKQLAPHRSGNLILAEADLLHRQGNFDEALRLYKSSIAYQPMLVSGYLSLSEFYTKRGDLILAETTLDQGLALLPTESVLNTALMQLQISQGEINSAQKTYEQLMSIAPSPEIALSHAQLTALKGKPDLALMEIDAIRKRWPGNLKTLRSGVALAINAGKLTEARTMATELVVTAPGYSSSWITLGNVYTAQAQFDLAEFAFLKSVKVEPGNSAAHVALGVFLDSRGKTGEARQSLERAINTDHTDVAPLLALAKVLIRLGEKDAAINELQVAADLDASKNSALLAIGQIRQNEGNFTKAKRFFLKAIDILPLDSSAYHAQSQIYLLEGKKDAALQSLMTATRMAIGDCRAFLNLANFYASHGEYSNAKYAYQQTLDRPGCQHQAHLGLGMIYQIQAQPEQAISEFLNATSSQPGTGSGYFATARIYTQQGKPLDAESTYKRGIVTLPASSLLRIAYIRSLIYSGKLYDGLMAAQETVRLMPTSASYLALGDAYEALGQFEDAKQNYIKAILSDHSASIPLLRLGDLYANLAEFDQAELHYRQAIELAPTQPQGYISLGNLLLSRGKTDEGIQVIEQSLLMNHGQNNALIDQARYYLRVGRFDDAADVLKRAFSSSSDRLPFQDEDVYVMIDDMESSMATIWVAMGDFYRLQARWTEAEKAYQQAIQQVPGLTNSYVSLGKAYQDQGRYSEAYEQFQKAIVVAPGVASPYIAFANLQLRQANFDVAEQAYQDANSASPGQAESIIQLGNLYLMQGRRMEAREQFEKATLVAPTAPLGWVALGDWLLAQADVQQAQQAYRHAVSVSPANPVGYIALGKYYQNRGWRADAMAEYQEAITIAPSSMLPYLALASWYHAEGNWEIAEIWYQQALKMDSEDIVGLLGIGYLKLAQNRPQDALLSFQSAQMKIPADSRTYVALGDWYLSNVNVNASRDAADAELANAEALLSQSERKQPPDEFIEYVFYEIKYLRDDQIEDAYTNFESAVAADPTSVLPYLAWGQWWRMGAGLLNAEQSYQLSIAAAPSDISGYLHLGHLYLITDRRDNALEQFEKADQLVPGSAIPHLYLADLYQTQYKISEAESEYKIALAITPGDIQAYIGLAEIYQSQGKYADAVMQYEIASTIGLPLELSVCGPGRLPSSPLGTEQIDIYITNSSARDSLRCQWDQRPWLSNASYR